ncbi:MAG: HAMP domain-containing sensor histidine kinase, partial [archaeon]
MQDEQLEKTQINQLMGSLYGYINPAMELHDLFRIIFTCLFQVVKTEAGLIHLVTREARHCYFGYTPEEGMVLWEPNETVVCPDFIQKIIDAYSVNTFEDHGGDGMQSSNILFVRLSHENTNMGYLAVQAHESNTPQHSILSACAHHIVQCIHQRKKFDDLLYHEKMVLLEKVFATLIHDIKNPLSGISGFVQLIDQKSVDDSIKKYCGIILASLSQLSDIVTEFRSVISGKDSQVHTEKIQVTALVSSIVESVRETYMHNRISLIPVCEDGLIVSGNKEKLATVFKHILKNAKESMLDGGTITIRTQKVQEMVVITIEDTGAGIPALMQDIVFKPFVSYNKENAA